MDPEQLKELKVLATKWDEQRTRAIAFEDFCSLMDYTQCFFGASLIPFGLARLLHHLLGMHRAPAPCKILLAKLLAIGQEKVPRG